MVSSHCVLLLKVMLPAHMCIGETQTASRLPDWLYLPGSCTKTIHHCRRPQVLKCPYTVICMDLCTHTRIHACMHARACARTHTHTHTHTQTRTHTNTHTHRAIIMYQKGLSIRGSVYVTHANVDSIVPVECLTGGHSATVRCAHWEHQVCRHVVYPPYNLLATLPCCLYVVVWWPVHDAWLPCRVTP